MQIPQALLITSMSLTLVACARGETLDPGGRAGTGGTGGSQAAGTGGGSAASAGSGAAGSAGATPGVCGLQTSDDACNDCINTVCFDSCNACASNQECLDLLACVKECTDSACENACYGQHPAGEAALDGFVGQSGCMTVNCADPCGSDTCGLTTSDDQCDTCMNASCYTECMACADTPDCLDLSGCLVNCNADSTCEDTCVSTYPQGLDPLMSLLGQDGCLATKCTTECG